MSRVSRSDKHLNSTFYESRIEKRQTFEIDFPLSADNVHQPEPLVNRENAGVVFSDFIKFVEG